MTRIIKDIKTDKDPDEALRLVRQYLKNQGFEEESYQGDFMSYGYPATSSPLSKKGPTGEIVWEKGKAVFHPPQFFRIVTQDSRIHLEAWGLSSGGPGRGFIYINEGILYMPGLNRRVIAIERMLSASNKEAEKIANRKAWFGPWNSVGWFPLTWQGWLSVSLLFISWATIFVIRGPLAEMELFLTLLAFSGVLYFSRG